MNTAHNSQQACKRAKGQANLGVKNVVKGGAVFPVRIFGELGYQQVRFQVASDCDSIADLLPLLIYSTLTTNAQVSMWLCQG